MQITTKLDGRVFVKMSKMEKDTILKAKNVARQLAMFASTSQEAATKLEEAAGNLLASLEGDKIIAAREDVPLEN